MTYGTQAQPPAQPPARRLSSTLRTPESLSKELSVRTAPDTPVSSDSPKKTLRDYVDDFLVDSGAEVPRPEQLQASPRTVRILAARRHWKKLLEVSETLLHEPEGGSSDAVLLTPLDRAELRFCRALAFVKTSMPEKALSELQRIWSLDTGEVDGNAEVERRQAFLKLQILLMVLEVTAAHNAEKAHLAIFSMHDVINAMADPASSSAVAASGTTEEALPLNLLFPLDLAELSQSLSDGDRLRWRLRFLTAVSTAHASRFQWRAAVQALEAQLMYIPKDAPVHGSAESPAVLRGRIQARAAVLSRICHIFIQVGAVPPAAKALEALEAEMKGRDGESAGLDPDPDPLISLARGSLFFSKGEYVKAQVCYRDAMDVERKRQAADVSLDSLGRSLGGSPRPMSPSVSGWRAGGVVPGVEGIGFDNDLVVSAANNLAIASLYTCQLGAAVQILEDLVREDPHRFLRKETAFNLCTLYDLSSEPSVAGRKKRVLQQIALRFHLEDLNASHFRIPG
uniref:Uncharacterized protein n=1 Tax=Pinguiococcus pyrenoidosus TaxID=172671 RepID=A0A7R9U0R3_9STRA|mmetsp:Transcript_10388/g.39303  ORF Transcript_10388/g.39303 Transcript_10388/m.39303 type:complete len:511 (+) Transcript_10388:90-1622(+)